MTPPGFPWMRCCSHLASPIRLPITLLCRREHVHDSLIKPATSYLFPQTRREEMDDRAVLSCPLMTCRFISVPCRHPLCHALRSGPQATVLVPDDRLYSARSGTNYRLAQSPRLVPRTNCPLFLRFPPCIDSCRSSTHAPSFQFHTFLTPAQLVQTLVHLLHLDYFPLQSKDA
jgi:hypothetical protein